MKNVSVNLILTAYFVCFLSFGLHAQWKQTPEFPANSGNIYSFAFSGTNIYVVTANGGVFRSNTGAASEGWKEMNDGLVISSTDWRPLLYCVYTTSSSLFCGTEYGMYRTSSGGGGWGNMYQGMINEEFRYPPIHSIIENGLHVYAGTSFFNGMYVSIDGGGSWTIMNNGLPAHVDIFCLANLGNSVIGGTDNGVFITSDNSKNWKDMSNGLPETYNIFSLAVAEQQLFAGTNGMGVYVFNDNAEKWAPVNEGLSCPFINSMVSSENSLYVGTDDGVSASFNLGADWSPLNTGLPESTFVLTLGTNGSELYAAVGGGDVWCMSMKDVGVKRYSSKPAIINSLRVTSSNGINIEFSLEKSEKVSIALYDVSGKLVVDLAEAQYTAGSHRISYQNAKLSPGFYIMRMQTNTGIQARKFALLK
jgi:photosystem II stability/assembly factor-like uncharacterized protein